MAENQNHVNEQTNITEDYDVLNNQSEQAGGDDDFVVLSNECNLLPVAPNGGIVGMSPSPSGECCLISKLPDKIRKNSEDEYTPESASIGPIHHDRKSTKAIKALKLEYMTAHLNRTGNREAKWEECNVSIRRLEEDLRKSYSEAIDLDNEQFIQMMILDGLFLIELFLKKNAGKTILSNKWLMSSLTRDLILFENQIPMDVLDELFKITMGNQGKSLTELAVRFFDPLMPRQEDVLKNCFDQKGKHLLDLFWKTLIHHLPKQVTSSSNSLNLKQVPCVSKLRKAGIKFKRGNVRGTFLDIKFTPDGEFEIPPILIHDQTETLLRNLIASEQFCDGTTTYLTSYAFLMDSLIDSSGDVQFLRDNGIITNCLGDDECVSSLFNNLCNKVSPVNFYYSDLCDQVNAYYKKCWNVRYGRMRHGYFQNPLQVASVVAGIALPVALASTSTVFSILSFAIHKS